MIEMNNVKKSYPGFDLDLSMKIGDGMITGLVGVNGAGKTTAFRILTGLERADAGQVTVFGQNPENMNVETKEKIGVVFSDSGFYQDLNAKAVKKIEQSFYSTFDAKMFDELCVRYEIDVMKPIRQLSTGMRARVKLVAAISHQPQLLILDEPTAGLDVLARDEILGLIQEYMEVPGRAVLISSHIASDLEGVCDELYMISDGRITLKADVDALLNEYGILKLTDAQHEEVDLRGKLGERRIPGGWEVLVRDRSYYQENYPELVLEKGSIDEIMRMENGGSK